MDTLGLSLLYIEDLQYHFHDIDPNLVVNHAYNLASYLLNNDNPMKDGDTVDGIRNGRIVQDIQWKCQYEDALIQPARQSWISVWESMQPDIAVDILHHHF